MSPRDPLTFGIAAIVMVLVASTSSFVPAWHAVHTDPTKAIREG